VKKEMNNEMKIFSGLMICLATLILFVTIPTPRVSAQFVLAWDYDSEKDNFDYDEYGQGFYLYTLHSNKSITTGNEYPDFTVEYPNYPTTYYFNQSSYSIQGTVGYALGIHFLCWMNSTLTGATDLDDGKNYIRANASISAFGTVLDNLEDIEVFYQTTFFNPEMWLYGFQANFNVIPQEGYTYIITLTYEVYW